LLATGRLFGTLYTGDSRACLCGWFGGVTLSFFENCRDDSANNRDGDEEDDLFHENTCVRYLADGAVRP
jgi:hypothetical protein